MSDVRQPTLSGHRRVDALWWPSDWFDEAVRRTRLLASWQPGARLYRFPQGDLLCLPEPRELDCDTLDAWPLQRVAGTLCSASVQPTDLAGRPVADAWLAVGAVLHPLHFDEAEAIDPARWLAIDLPFVVPMDLRLPEPERELVIPPARALHEVLGPGVPDGVAPDTQRLMDALRSASARKAQAETRNARQITRASGGSGWSVFAIVAVVVAAVFFLMLLAMKLPDGGGAGLVTFLVVLGMASLLRGARSPGGGGVGGGGGQGTGPGSSSGEGSGLRARLQRSRVVPQRWRNALARLAATSGLGRLLGGQHAAYMRRVLEMFDDGRLDEALRHAVPLGSDGESLGQAFGRLGPRSDLSLGVERGPSVSVSFGDSFENHLRQLYRRAFEQLDRAGRVDEAVYVLAELLRSRQEALDYLEQKGRFAQAAELAFAWDMPAVQIVRLHVLAKDWRRALAIARRDECFADAITQLETRWPEHARQLRIEWAEWLAARGRCVEAIQALWPLADERPRATAWLDVADAAGGALAARSLAWRAQGWPDTLASRGEFIDALRHDPAARGERRALVNELLRLKAPLDPAVRRLAALVLGATIADQADPHPTQNRGALIELHRVASDAPLTADLPDLPPSFGRTERPLSAATSALELPVPPAGLAGIVDAVPLADGEFLLALGEAGAVRVDGHGRRLAFFSAPAERLVLADDRGCALALARREGTWRVSRLDLATRRTVDLGLHALDAFSDRFDAGGWAIAQGKRVQVVDILSPSLREAVWQVADLPGPVVAIDRGESHLERWIMASEAGADRFHEWVYLLPSRRLQSRDETAAPTLVADQPARRMLVRGRGLFEFHPDERDATRLVMKGALGTWTMPLLQGDILLAAEEWLAWQQEAEGHHELRLVRWLNGIVQARWTWPADAQPRMRFHRGTCLVFDGLGRLCVLDTQTSVQHELSLR